ncbi:MerR family transcriptional regulator [uncultured Nisaea sp.]|uniref:MerR family transcriptional regulator n=1 Tax=uncultured Nisaea sp. TaxID=538215 RepID=UPI0030EC53B3|tara:strand:- start:539 stop:1003 length:465 start_codon:yes stop_codon:yes gene_type:complete
MAKFEMTAKTHFTTKEAARIVGFRSPYMVDYLHRSGVVVASKLRNPGRGKPRLYNYSDLLLLKAMKSLLDRRIPVAKLKQAQRDFRKYYSKGASKERLAKFMITDGKNVFYKENAGAIVELSNGGQLAFAFIIDMDVQQDHIEKSLVKMGFKAA